MSTLKIGYDLFKEPSQAGTHYADAGVIQVVTAKALAYRLEIKRLSNDYFWNHTTGAWVASAPAESANLLIQGSDATRPSALRRLACKIPKEALVGIDGDGAIFTAFAAGDTPATEGVAMTLAFELDA